mmetsp:Transcript_444/g.640  ORF Transcript_444/g.640 Transcript_444/m.640 type:complete len:815 (-) Transcript_444:83-2527(-)
MAATESQVQQGAWQQPTGGGENIRSVTPAMNNTRGGGQASAQRGKYPSRVPSPGAAGRSPSPSGPSSSGLIRLTLRKPMGIVFEPMYDPNAPSIQRGVRICDLPRTGAAALSRRLEIGDELLSINDKTMSRLTFDEIMDFIIEADPEQVNLLFRRPRKEVLAARNAMKSTPSNANAATSVKWIDDDDGKKDKKRSSSKSKKKKDVVNDDETLDTLDETRSENHGRKSSRKKKSSDRRSSTEHEVPYESESFLDLLIDTICANPDNVCKNSASRANADEEYYSEDDVTLDPDDRTMTSYDDSTYVTYESTDRKKDESVYDETDNEDDHNKKDKIYEDDTTLDTYEQIEEKKKPAEKKSLLSPFRKKTPVAPAPKASPKPAPPVSPKPASPSPKRVASPAPRRTPTQPPVDIKPIVNPSEQLGAADDANKAPITDLEFDDHGADVSVMESLGGPSLLIEKQRQTQMLQKQENIVPTDIINEFGADYPADYGLTREQTINKNPIKFYAFVVRHLLEEHEPEKVRLLDKLLAKYKGREDHLVQKLSVRYNRKEENQDFTDAVNQTKENPETERAVQKAQERAAAAFGVWPDKETKEPEPADVVPAVVQKNDEEDGEDDDDEEEDEDSDFSGDSIDGTSPAVIAQVSELLNYVYGKTSVPGQIDRVSTIMRAYEGREAVLLELLETKALIKANSEKENAANLPAFLRNSPALAPKQDAVSPLSSPPNQNAVPNSMINDDISSMSGVSSPVPETKAAADKEAPASKTTSRTTTPSTAQRSSAPETASSRKRNSQKKKGLFGGLFKKKSSRIRGRKEETEI